MSLLMGAVAPSQIAKFLLWIERNEACMHMLTKIWHAGDAAAAGSASGDGGAVGGAGSAPARNGGGNAGAVAANV